MGIPGVEGGPVGEADDDVMEDIAGNVEGVETATPDARTVKVGFHALREGGEKFAEGGGSAAGVNHVGSYPVLASFYIRSRAFIKGVVEEASEVVDSAAGEGLGVGAEEGGREGGLGDGEVGRGHGGSGERRRGGFLPADGGFHRVVREKESGRWWRKRGEVMV